MKSIRKIFFFVFFFILGLSVCGQVNQNSGQITKTKELYADLIDNPNNNDKRFQLVELLLYQNNISEARYQLSYLAPNFQYTSKYKSLEKKLKDLLELSNRNEINTNYETLKYDPKNISAIKSTVFNFFKVEDYESAREILEESIEINPESKELKYLYAQTLYNLNLKEQSFNIMTDLVNKYEPNIDQKLLYSRLAVWFGKDLKRSEDFLKSIIEEEPSNIYASISLCLLNIKTGNIEKAHEYFDKAEAIDFDNPELDLIRREYLIKTPSRITSNPKQDNTSSFNKIFNLQRSLEKDPNNTEVRLQLIDEYLAAGNVKDAEIQLQYLEPNLEGSIIFDSYKDRLGKIIRESREQRVNELLSVLKSDPENRNAALELSEILNSNSDFDGAEEILAEYLSFAPDDDETRYKLASILFASQSYSEAENQLLILNEKNPFENKYLLLSARIKIAESEDLDKAEDQLKSILKDDPENLDAIVNLAVLFSKLKFFDSARYYAEKAIKLDPNNPEVLQLNSLLKNGAQDETRDKTDLLLKNARKNLENGNCESAADEYEEYLDQIKSYEVMLELADAYHCAGNITSEIAVLHDILEIQFNLPIAKRHAKLIYQYGQYEIAYDQLKLVNTFDPNDYEIKDLMGNALIKMGEYEKAKSVYSDLLLTSPQPDKIRSKLDEIDELIKESRNFHGSFNAFNSDFLTNLRLKPYTNYYGDNQNMELFEAGGGVNINLTNFISAEFNFGAGLKRADSKNYSYQAGFGSLAFKPQRNLLFKTIIGTRFNQGRPNQPIMGAIIQYVEPDHYNLSIGIDRKDAAEYLLSKGLTDNDLTISNISFNAKYIFFTDLVLEGNYNYYFIPEITDAIGITHEKNNGQNLIFRVYRYFIPQIYAGYEYEFTHFLNANFLYFSPQLFDSHSIITAYKFYKRNLIEMIFEGKIGYLAQIDKSLKAVSLKINFIPFEPLAFDIKASLVDTYRYQTRYNFGLISATIFLKIF